MLTLKNGVLPLGCVRILSRCCKLRHKGVYDKADGKQNVRKITTCNRSSGEDPAKRRLLPRTIWSAIDRECVPFASRVKWQLGVNFGFEAVATGICSLFRRWGLCYWLKRRNMTCTFAVELQLEFLCLRRKKNSSARCEKRMRDLVMVWDFESSRRCGRVQKGNQGELISGPGMGSHARTNTNEGT